MDRHLKGNRVNIPEPEQGYCHLVAPAATQPNSETLAVARGRVLFSFNGQSYPEIGLAGDRVSRPVKPHTY